MTVERRFEPRGRKIAWVAIGLGLFLVGDAIWCLWRDQLWVAMVVGGVGLERLVFAATDYWHRRIWPYRMVATRLDTDGLWFEERNMHDGTTRTTQLPAGLVLDARVRRDITRGEDGQWVVLLFTILGTIVWSTHSEDAAADADLQALKRVLDARPDAELVPPTPTNTLEIIGPQRGVMWGAAPVVPASIALRASLLFGTILAVPNLVGAGAASVMLWILTIITIALLAFPFAGAAIILQRRGTLMGFGATAQFGELRAYERSAVSQVVALSNVRHVGFNELELNGEPIAMRLVAHAEEGTQVDAIVPRSQLAHLALAACRVVAQLHDPPDDEPDEWSVRLPGGVAEAIEAVSWIQRFMAEAKAERPDTVN